MRKRKGYKKIIKYIKKGAIEGDTFWENQKDKLLIASSLTLAVFSCGIMMLFWAMGILEDTVLAAIGGVIFLLPYYFNKRQQKFLARLVLCVGFVLYFTIFSIFLGKGAGLEYVLIVAAILPALFFDKKRITVPLFVFSLFCFALCKVSFYYLPISFPHFAWVYIYDGVLLGVFMLIFLIVNKFKLLQTANDSTIQKMVKALKMQHEELNMLHAKLSAQTEAIEKGAIVATTDIKGNITYVNDNFTKVSKFTAEEAIGQTHQIINSGYHPRAFWKEMWQTIGNGKIWRAEVCNRAKDGALYWVDSSIIPVLNDKGKPEEYLAIRFVITKQKEAEKKLKSRNAKITSSLNYAKRIQSAILPSKQKITKLIPEHFVLFQPKDTVSGDFYWISEAAGKTILVAADCTGHGVPGAFMSMISTMLLDKLVNIKGITAPDILLNELHRNTYTVLKQEETGNQDGMDISICTIDHEEGILEFAGARNPLVIIENGVFKKIKGDRMSIGGGQLKRPAFTKHQFSLQPNAFYYMFSDGFQDQFGGPFNKKFMAKRFYSLLQAASLIPISEQQQMLKRELDNWSSVSDQTDDVLIIGFQAKPQS